MPLFHVNALLVSILAPLSAGGGAWILERFDRRSFWQSVRDSGATYFSGAPAMYLLLSAERGLIAPAPLLRFAVCGAAPRLEEHTSELQSLMRKSYAAFCLKTKIQSLMRSST